MNTKQTKKSIFASHKTKVKAQKKKKVFVGMSGGVDSSVAAAMLKNEGYEVVGVFMKVWEPPFLPCTWRAERLDAMRVAAHLGIPLLTWDFEKEYKQGVADYMISEYKAGRTPNPDVMCNREVKFGAFFDRAVKAGADFVATGHYARVALNKKNNTYEMLAGVDPAKDQSYFLWTLGQKQLSKTLFPVGYYKKSQIRALAKKFSLPTAEKKDSQGLCFVGKLDMKDFLERFIPGKKGSVLNKKGEVIGTHRGAYFYTLGERHGFAIAKKGTEDTAYYVVSKDIVANTITVSQSKNDLSAPNAKKIIELEQASYCGGLLPDTKKKYTAQIRYHGEQYPCVVTSSGKNEFALRFMSTVVVASGQSVVLYDGERCVGGGIVT